MKQGIKYTIIIILFFIAMFFVVSIFSNRYDKVEYENLGKNLLKKLYDLEEGDYSYKYGVLSNSENIYRWEIKAIDGEGLVNVDKYGNIKFYINVDRGCVFKTSTGNVKYMKSKCNGFDSVDIELIKNNNKISFKSSIDNLSYKISSKDDFEGEWINKEYSGNLLINSFSEGDNYIWFKSKDGRISEVVTFSVDCLNSRDTIYDKNVFYCSGSIVNLDNTDWIVVKDESDKITLMKKNPLDVKISHCYLGDDQYCSGNESSIYRWSTSKVNDYLNNTFINTFSQSTLTALETEYICDEYVNYTCDDGNCGGYKKSIINKNNWSCTDYSPSKVRIPSFDEYNYIYSKLGESSLIRGSYLLINSLEHNNASIVDNNFSVFIKGNILEEYKIRPVITLKK